jgi:general stress protein 26
MILDFNKSKEEAWRDIKHEIHRGALDKKHPFRFLVLSTFGDNGIESRWVVMREVSELLHMYIYSDARTQKVKDLKSCEQAHVLFFHEKKGLQIRCKGKVELNHQNNLSKEHWKRVQGLAQRAYTPEKAPGSLLESPDQAHKWNMDFGDQYFSVLEFIPEEFDVLQLNRLEHLRLKIEKKGKDWIRQWVAP